MTDIISLIIKHEGLRLYPYKDSVGKLTIGVGRNIEDNGISRHEAMYMLKNDIRNVTFELKRFRWFDSLTTDRQNALIDMCFNLGISRFYGFKKMISALEAGNYERAAEEMKDSKWCSQVGKRCDNLAEMMLGKSERGDS